MSYYYFGGCNLSENDINRIHNKNILNNNELIYKTHDFYICYSKDAFKISRKNEIFLLMEGYIYNPCVVEHSGPKNFGELQDFLSFESDLNNIYGAFTLCFKNQSNVLLVRDYPGIFSVYYVLDNDKLYFSNDYIYLRSMGFENIEYLKPGSSIEFDLRTKNIKKVDYYKPIPTVLDDDPVNQLDDLLLNVTKSLLDATSNKNNKVAILLSGGVDSSLIAYYLSQIYPDVYAFTIAGKDNNFANKVINSLNINHKFIDVSDEQWQNHSSIFPKKIYNDNFYKLANSLFLPNYFLLKSIQKSLINLVFSGVGSDEIFASYSRHFMYMENISYATRKIIDDCHIYYLEAIELASKLSGNSICLMPFLTKEIIDFGLSLPDKFKMHNNIEKWIIRKIAEKHLPRTIAWREISPLQYSTDSFKKVNGSSYYESFYC